jgi:putative aldouronate transport system substrate-binding protein
MKLNRKLLTRVFAVVLCLVFVLAGCGNETQPTSSETPSSTTPSSTEPSQSATPAAALDPVTLTFYCVGDSQDMSGIEKGVNEYLKDTLNITLEYECFGWGDTYTPKINPMLAAGDPIDIVFTSNWAANFRSNATAGYFTVLNDYIKKYPGVEQVLGSDFLNATQIDGKNYAVPTNKEKAHNWGFLLKKDLVAKYNIDLNSIKSLQDLEPYFDRVLAEEPGMTPLLSVQMDGPWHLLDWNTFSDDDVPGALYPDNRDTKVINQFLAPESVALYKQQREYYKKGYLHPDAATQDNFSAEMSTGKYFAFVAPMKPGKAVEMTQQTGVEWEEIFITPIVMSNREADGAMLAIPVGSKNPERAFMFIEKLYTDAKLKNLMNFGVEGVHYKWSDDKNYIIPIEESGYKTSGGWRFGDNFKDYLTVGEALDKAQQWEKYNASATPLLNLGFVFDATNVASEVAACKDVVQTYYKQLFTGSVDVDPTLARMEADFKAAGVDTLLQEIQTQFDAWLASKK